MKSKIDKTNIKIISMCALGCLSAYFLLSVFQLNRNSQVHEEGEAFLKEQAELDVVQVSNNIAMANHQILLNAASSKEERVRIRFHNSIVVGDSIAEAFDEYDMLSASNVVAKRGMRTDNCEEDIDRVIALAPANVFLSYGMNDLEYCRGDEVCFSSQYQKVLEKLQKELPSAKLYVSAILPTTSLAAQEVPAYKAYKAYNEALIEVCEKMDITYYDASDLLPNEDAYEVDGVHPKYAFYPIWLQRMVDIAGL